MLRTWNKKTGGGQSDSRDSCLCTGGNVGMPVAQSPFLPPTGFLQQPFHAPVLICVQRNDDEEIEEWLISKTTKKTKTPD
ncbi:MAG: hypothetical protein RBS28_02220 [Rhodocyclaceae bacterium]|jgi:hypothetical protein|nr:hypothetical protein [Rhodocyclaceae bacterium]